MLTLACLQDLRLEEDNKSSKPIELDIEAGNLVLLQKRFQHFKLFDCLRCEFIMPTDHPPSVVVLQFLS